MAEDERKAELTTALARSRSQISLHVHDLRRDLDFAGRARRAFTRHPAVWIGGAVVLGLMISRLPLRRKKAPTPHRKADSNFEKVEKAGLVLGALKIAFDIAKPTLMGWATRRVSEYFGRGNHGGAARR
jgi:hypothetical protein